MKKINVITLGCSKNTVDSEHLMARLAAAGIGRVELLGEDTYANPEAYFSFRRATHRGRGR